MKKTDATQFSSLSIASQINEPAAWVAILATAAAILLLIALHALSPEFSPSWRMISEYAFGRYSWVLSLMFLSSAIGTWALVLAIRSQLHTNTGKLGLYFLTISGLGSAMASIFDIRHEIGHEIAGFMGVIGFPIAALLLSSALTKDQSWKEARRQLLWLANLSWISVVLLVVTLAMMTMQMLRVNGGHLPQHAPKSLPPGVLPLDGWADRLIVLSDWGWVLLAAWHAIQVCHKHSLRADFSTSPVVVNPDSAHSLN